MSIELIRLWHKRAVPQPTARDFDVQLGCHFEEVLEQLDSLDFPGNRGIADDARNALYELATKLKSGEATATIANRKEFLDAAADQVVTAVGAAYRANMDIAEAVYRVNQSNWSKYVDGQPVFNEHGKIAKGPGYKAPDLEGLY